MQINICSTPVPSTRRNTQRTSRPTHPLVDLDALADIIPYGRHQQICLAAHTSEYWFRIISGATATRTLGDEAPRQNLDVAIPGDIFGFALHDDHAFAVEALAEGTLVARYPRWCVELLAASEPATAQMLRNLALRAISRMQVQMLSVGPLPARATIAGFLLDMADRLSRGTSNWFDLPISRGEMADYLALSVETMGRTLTGLSKRGIVDLAGARHVRIADHDALEEIADAF